MRKVERGTSTLELLALWGVSKCLTAGRRVSGWRGLICSSEDKDSHHSHHCEAKWLSQCLKILTVHSHRPCMCQPAPAHHWLLRKTGRRELWSYKAGLSMQKVSVGHFPHGSHLYCLPRQSRSLSSLLWEPLWYFLILKHGIGRQARQPWQRHMLELRFKTLMIAITQFPVLGIVFVQQPMVLQSL